jgi:hypothetical protein
MSADFRTVLIRDSRLGITDELSYAVQSGGSNVTYQQYQAITATASNMVFNCQIPSESIVIAREILLQSTLSMSFAISGVTLGASAFDYGSTDAFQAFPLAKLMTTLTSTINNCNVSVNLQDVIDPLLRLNDSRELFRYNGMTPALPDQAYLDYGDGVGAINNPLANYSTASYDVDQLPRGCFPAEVRVYRYTNASGANYADQSTIALGSAGERWVVCVTASLTEPLFLSPIIFGDPCYNMQGFSGINTMNFVANIDSTCKRAFSTSNNWTVVPSLGCPAVTGAVNAPQVQPFVGTRLLFNFLSTQPSDLIPVRNVLPYQEFPRYLSLSTNNPALVPDAIATISSQNIQLNQIPDYFMIYARKPMSSQTIKDSASFLQINQISCNFNNASGLLASATQADLWRISVANGSTQSWVEFSGLATSTSIAGTGTGVLVPTTGSILILSPSQNLSLADYLSSGSIGQYLFQFNITLKNNYNATFQPEIVVVCCNSGVFTTVSGSSNIYTGLLTKQMVLDAKEKRDVRPVEQAVYRRMVGGKMAHSMASAVKRMPMISSKHLTSGIRSDAGLVGMGGSSGGAHVKMHSRLHKYL